MKKYYPQYLKHESIDTTVLFRFAYRCDAHISMLENHLKKQKSRITSQKSMRSLENQMFSTNINFNADKQENISKEENKQSDSEKISKEQVEEMSQSFQIDQLFVKKITDSCKPQEPSSIQNEFSNQTFDEITIPKQDQKEKGVIDL